MPFRTILISLPPDKARKIYTAEAGDVEVEIRSAPLYENQGSVSYNFGVGGPELDEDRSTALFCNDGQYSTAVEEGDELWAVMPGVSAAWTEQDVRLTIMVRSRPADKPVAKPRQAAARSR